VAIAVEEQFRQPFDTTLDHSADAISMKEFANQRSTPSVRSSRQEAQGSTVEKRLLTSYRLYRWHAKFWSLSVLVRGVREG
jgi:hypothetical protein